MPTVECAILFVEDIDRLEMSTAIKNNACIRTRCPKGGCFTCPWNHKVEHHDLEYDIELLEKLNDNQ